MRPNVARLRLYVRYSKYEPGGHEFSSSCAVNKIFIPAYTNWLFHVKFHKKKKNIIPDRRFVNVLKKKKNDRCNTVS